MKREIFEKNAFEAIRDILAPVVFTLVVVVMVVIGLWRTEVSTRAEGLRLPEESVMRAVFQCYAVEGSYPADVAHIEERYGVYIDRTRYAVHYEIFASNILPDITVVELAGRSADENDLWR